MPHAAPIVELVHGPLVESEKDGVVAEPVVDVPGVRVGNKKPTQKNPPKNVGHGPVDKAPGCCKVALSSNPRPSTPKMGSSKVDEQPTGGPTKSRG